MFDDFSWSGTVRSKVLFQSPKYKSRIRQDPSIFATPTGPRNADESNNNGVHLVVHEAFRVLIVGALWAACFSLKASPDQGRMWLLSEAMFGIGFCLFINACIRYGKHKREQSGRQIDSVSAMRERVSVFNLPLAYLIFFWITQEIFKRM
jgi:hypothetical protein